MVAAILRVVRSGNHDIHDSSLWRRNVLARMVERWYVVELSHHVFRLTNSLCRLEGFVEYESCQTNGSRYVLPFYNLTSIYSGDTDFYGFRPRMGKTSDRYI